MRLVRPERRILSSCSVPRSSTANPARLRWKPPTFGSSVATSAFIATNPEALVSDRLRFDATTRSESPGPEQPQTGRRVRGTRVESFDCEHVLDRLLPMVERKIKEAPVDGHEQAIATQSTKAANRSFRAHVYVGPEGI